MDVANVIDPLLLVGVVNMIHTVTTPSFSLARMLLETPAASATQKYDYAENNVYKTNLITYPLNMRVG